MREQRRLEMERELCEKRLSAAFFSQFDWPNFCRFKQLFVVFCRFFQFFLLQFDVLIFFLSRCYIFTTEEKGCGENYADQKVVELSVNGCKRDVPW